MKLSVGLGMAGGMLEIGKPSENIALLSNICILVRSLLEYATLLSCIKRLGLIGVLTLGHNEVVYGNGNPGVHSSKLAHS